MQENAGKCMENAGKCGENADQNNSEYGLFLRNDNKAFS